MPDELVKEAVKALESEMNGFISNKVSECRDGIIPAADMCNHVRERTKDLIDIAYKAKNSIVTKIVSKINGNIPNPFTELDNIEKEIHKKKADMITCKNEKQKYQEMEKKSDYDLFLTFYNDFQKKDKKGKKQIKNYEKKDNVSRIAEDMSQKICNAIKQSFIWCVLIAVVFTAIDAYMLFEPFSTGNLGDKIFTFVTCIIFAGFLDCLPTAHGFTSAKIQNLETQLLKKQSLKGDNTKYTEAEEKQLKKSKSTQFWITVTIWILFIIYIVARLLLILGGGDFNVGINLLSDFFLKTDYVTNPEEIERQFADITIITPIASSIFANVVSKWATRTESDYFDKFVQNIKKELKADITEYQTREEQLEKDKDELEKRKIDKKFQLWSRYYGNEKSPLDDEIYISRIIAAVHTEEKKAYSGIYENFCRQTRSAVTTAIRQMQSKLSSFCNQPSDVTNMKLVEDEKKHLDYIWNIDENAEQSKQTKEDIAILDNRISDTLKRWSDNNMKKSEHNENQNNNEDKNANQSKQTKEDIETIEKQISNTLKRWSDNNMTESEQHKHKNHQNSNELPLNNEDDKDFSDSDINTITDY